MSAVQVLRQLPDQVLPRMSDPLLLAEFLTRATDAGGFTAHLALRSLFLLVSAHGLEYANFWGRLYGLLTPALFQARPGCVSGVCLVGSCASGLLHAVDLIRRTR